MIDTHTLYERIDGAQALAGLVDEFYRRVLGDPQLALQFAGTDMRRQKWHQTMFLAMALGGPSGYEGRTLREAHAGRNISDAQFAAVVGHLQATLQWAGVAAADQADILATTTGLRDQIVRK
ncbi:MAG: group 1 truncated hemoglobin [Planctomycetota bacterium]